MSVARPSTGGGGGGGTPDDDSVTAAKVLDGSLGTAELSAAALAAIGSPSVATLVDGATVSSAVGSRGNVNILSTSRASLTMSNPTGTLGDGKVVVYEITCSQACTIAWGANFIDGGVNKPTAFPIGNHRVIYAKSGSNLICSAALLQGLPAGTGDMLKADNLSGLSSYPTARTTMGLAIGSDVQAYHANLAALAGQTGAADKVSYWTGAGALALANLSAYIRTLTGAADSAAARAVLGVTGGTATFIPIAKYAGTQATPLIFGSLIGDTDIGYLFHGVLRDNTPVPASNGVDLSAMFNGSSSSIEILGTKNAGSHAVWSQSSGLLMDSGAISGDNHVATVTMFLWTSRTYGRVNFEYTASDHASSGAPAPIWIGQGSWKATPAEITSVSFNTTRSTTLQWDFQAAKIVGF